MGSGMEAPLPACWTCGQKDSNARHGAPAAVPQLRKPSFMRSGDGREAALAAAGMLAAEARRRLLLAVLVTQANAPVCRTSPGQAATPRRAPCGVMRRACPPPRAPSVPSVCCLVVANAQEHHGVPVYRIRESVQLAYLVRIDRLLRIMPGHVFPALEPAAFSRIS